jgi:phosphoribosyl-ATP pyrophosphohydrolase
MYVKTFKIKAGMHQQEIALSHLIDTNAIIYNTNSELIKEVGDYYWHIMIVYESKEKKIAHQERSNTEQLLLSDFKKAIKQYSEKNPATNNRFNNCINYYSENLLTCKVIKDFKGIRGIGTKSIEENKEFILGLLDIIKTYQDQLKKQHL